MTGVWDGSSDAKGAHFADGWAELSFEPDPRRAARVPPSLSGPRLGRGPGHIGLLLGALRRNRVSGRSPRARTETCQAIFGARPIQSGACCGGRELRPLNPADSMAQGISMLPEDRKEEGLFIDFTIAANIAAANLPAYTHNGLLSKAEIRQIAQHYTDALRIMTPSIDRDVRYLSGATARRCCLPNGWRGSPASSSWTSQHAALMWAQGGSLPHPARSRCQRHGPPCRVVRSA